MSSFFNLPFGVRVAGAEPVDGDRYLGATEGFRDALITTERAFEGVQVFQEDTKTLYILETLVQGDPINSVWTEIGSGGGATGLGATNGLQLYGASADKIGLGGTLTVDTEIDASGNEFGVTGAEYIRLSANGGTELIQVYEFGDTVVKSDNTVSVSAGNFINFGSTNINLEFPVPSHTLGATSQVLIRNGAFPGELQSVSASEIAQLAPSTGSTNGLSAFGDSIGLGGTLSVDTTIDGANGNTFTVSSGASGIYPTELSISTTSARLESLGIIGTSYIQTNALSGIVEAVSPGAVYDSKLTLNGGIGTLESGSFGSNQGIVSVNDDNAYLRATDGTLNIRVDVDASKNAIELTAGTTGEYRLLTDLASLTVGSTSQVVIRDTDGSLKSVDATDIAQLAPSTGATNGLSTYDDALGLGGTLGSSLTTIDVDGNTFELTNTNNRLALTNTEISIGETINNKFVKVTSNDVEIFAPGQVTFGSTNINLVYDLPGATIGLNTEFLTRSVTGDVETVTSLDIGSLFGATNGITTYGAANNLFGLGGEVSTDTLIYGATSGVGLTFSGYDNLGVQGSSVRIESDGNNYIEMNDVLGGLVNIRGNSFNIVSTADVQIESQSGDINLDTTSEIVITNPLGATTAEATSKVVVRDGDGSLHTIDASEISGLGATNTLQNVIDQSVFGASNSIALGELDRGVVSQPSGVEFGGTNGTGQGISIKHEIKPGGTGSFSPATTEIYTNNNGVNTLSLSKGVKFGDGIPVDGKMIYSLSHVGFGATSSFDFDVDEVKISTNSFDTAELYLGGSPITTGATYAAAIKGNGSSVLLDTDAFAGVEIVGSANSNVRIDDSNGFLASKSGNIASDWYIANSDTLFGIKATNDSNPFLFTKTAGSILNVNNSEGMTFAAIGGTTSNIAFNYSGDTNFAGSGEFNVLAVGGIVLNSATVELTQNLLNIPAGATSQVMVRDADGIIKAVDASDIATVGTSYSETLVSWTDNGDETFYADVNHNLNTTDIVYNFRDTVTNRAIEVDEVEYTDANNIRIFISDNTSSIRISVMK